MIEVKQLSDTDAHSISREIVDFKQKMENTALLGWLTRQLDQPDRLDEGDSGHHNESYFGRIRTYIHAEKLEKGTAALPTEKLMTLKDKKELERKMK